MVEGARLESVYTGNRIEGSNPSLSAKYRSPYVPTNLKYLHKTLKYQYSFNYISPISSQENSLHPDDFVTIVVTIFYNNGKNHAY